MTSKHKDLGPPIRTRLWQGLSLLITMALIGGGVNFHLCNQAAQETQRALAGAVTIRCEADNALAAMRLARQLEADFLASRDTSYLPQVEEAIREAQQSLDNVESLSEQNGNTTNLQLAQQAMQAIAKHSEVFNELTALTIERGLTENEGAEGQLRIAVHTLESPSRTPSSASYAN